MQFVSNAVRSAFAGRPLQRSRNAAKPHGLECILAPRRAAVAALAAFVLGLVVWSAPSAVQAQPGAANRNDEVLLQMKQAFQRKDAKRLAALWPQAQGHSLEPWAAYWTLKVRLEDASAQEVQDFLTRYAGSYQEDRLRNDWLLLLGKRADWNAFAVMHGGYRMQDDREVRCYAILVDAMKGGATKAQADEVRANWLAQRDNDDGCTLAAERLIAAKLLSPNVAWKKARLAMEANRARAARDAIAIVAPDALPLFDEVNKSAARFLVSRAAAVVKSRREMVTLALLRLANADPDTAAAELEGKWGPLLSAEERNWLWGAIGRQAALKLSNDANGYFRKVSRLGDLSDEMLAWKTRAALRAGQWKDVSAAIDAMSEEARQDSTWVYWKARALLAQSGLGAAARQAEAAKLLQGIAGPSGFYEQLALEELGQKITLPPRPAPLTPQEKAAARANAGLARGLYAILAGLRAEGVREWNYETNLHQRGGMNERELLAAADYACEHQVFDRCINTSERTRTVIEQQQRFPMPHLEAVRDRAAEIGIDPAYVYGLIRQESRFIMDVRSHVGASGLMQLMPATARWTARKIGMSDFRISDVNERDTNIALGTAYLKLALDDFDGSLPLAAAAYNAGPGRPRNWRNGPVVEGAIWAENVPFSETRDYVKKVLANTVNYAAVLTGQPQSLKARLGSVGPRPASEPAPNKDLP